MNFNSATLGRWRWSNGEDVLTLLQAINLPHRREHPPLLFATRARHRRSSRTAQHPTPLSPHRASTGSSGWMPINESTGAFYQGMHPLWMAITRARIQLGVG